MAVPQDFIKSLSDAGGHSSPAHFEVVFDVSPESDFLPLHLRCHQAVIPGLTAATSQYATGMPEKNSAYRPTYEDVTLGFYCTETLIERKYFESWQGLIFPLMGHRGQSPSTALKDSKWMTWPVGYRDDYTKKVIIKKLSWDGEVTKQYILHKAFPVTINETPLDWSQEEILKIEVVFSYDWFTVQDVHSTTTLLGNRREKIEIGSEGRANWEKQKNDAIRKHQSLTTQTRTEESLHHRQEVDIIRKKRTVTEESVRGQFWLPQDTPFMGPPSPTDAQRKQMASNMRKENFAAKHPDVLMGMVADAGRPGNIAAAAMKSVPTPSPTDARTRQDIAAEIFNPFKRKTRSLNIK